MGSSSINQAIVLTSDFRKYITLNTLFVAVVVLSVLILIMLVTYFVTIKPNLNIGNSEKLVKNEETNVFDRITMMEEEELINDHELVAVITAAIYASMGDQVPTDGLVVRSIRKVNSKKWMNA